MLTDIAMSRSTLAGLFARLRQGWWRCEEVSSSKKRIHEDSRALEGGLGCFDELERGGVVVVDGFELIVSSQAVSTSAGRLCN